MLWASQVKGGWTSFDLCNLLPSVDFEDWTLAYEPLSKLVMSLILSLVLLGFGTEYVLNKYR
jgi:hypothetical protein